jgi:hypothetical protein
MCSQLLPVEGQEERRGHTKLHKNRWPSDRLFPGWIKAVKHAQKIWNSTNLPARPLQILQNWQPRPNLPLRSEFALWNTAEPVSGIEDFQSLSCSRT